MGKNESNLYEVGAGMQLPPIEESAAYCKLLGKRSLSELLAQADERGITFVQPRIGFGDLNKQLQALLKLEAAGADVATLTIDSFTRLLLFEEASRLVRTAPERLNGFPLVHYGPEVGRKLNLALKTPLQIRHGSPDPRVLFHIAVASGITAFEGGAIGYTIPYSKDVPLDRALKAWDYVDHCCGSLARLGIDIDRELFGTLTAVLVPPSLSIAIATLEAISASRAGVTCISIGFPQGGNLVQDVAALRAIRSIAATYIPHAKVYPTLHQFMGPFPKDPAVAEGLIIRGALTARMGKATRVITKTRVEALGIPSIDDNLRGVEITRAVLEGPLGDFTLPRDAVDEEAVWIEREVKELIDPILEKPDLHGAICTAFAHGWLDVPFSASRYARSDVIPMRDVDGAICYQAASNFPFSDAVRARHQRMLSRGTRAGRLTAQVLQDIDFFAQLKKRTFE